MVLFSKTVSFRWFRQTRPFCFVTMTMFYFVSMYFKTIDKIKRLLKRNHKHLVSKCHILNERLKTHNFFIQSPILTTFIRLTLKSSIVFVLLGPVYILGRIDGRPKHSKFELTQASTLCVPCHLFYFMEDYHSRVNTIWVNFYLRNYHFLCNECDVSGH